MVLGQTLSKSARKVQFLFLFMKFQSESEGAPPLRSSSRSSESQSLITTYAGALVEVLAEPPSAALMTAVLAGPPPVYLQPVHATREAELLASDHPENDARQYLVQLLARRSSIRMLRVSECPRLQRASRILQLSTWRQLRVWHSCGKLRPFQTAKSFSFAVPESNF